MAESNATQVILTDDGIKIIKAQSTADNAASQAENADSAALIAKSTANAAKSAADSTYAYANSEINSNSTATAKAQSTADNAFSQAQAVGSQASADIVVQSTATAKAQSTADNAFSQAQAVGSQASAEIQNNSTATAKAQSTADNAFSQATTAIDNGKVTSQAVTNLKDGSKLTIAELENGLATKVANSEYTSYKIQTASQIAQKVDNGAFSAYQTQTADLIAQKVATKDFSAYQATTAKEISSKVESSDFNTYKTQTAGMIDDKVSNSAYASDKTQTASEIADRVSNSAFSTYQTQTASQIASKVDNGAFSAYQTQTADLIAQKVATKDFSAYQATTAKEISSKVESKDFNTYKTQTADLIDDKVSNSAYASDKTQTASEIADRVSNSAFSTYQTQTASQIAQKVDNGAFSAYQQTTADLISSKVATKDFSAYQDTTAKAISSKVESSDFNTYKTQTDNAIISKVSSIDFNNLGGGRNYLLNSKLITITPTGQANYDYRIYLSDDFWKNPDRLIANNIKVSFTMHVQNALSTEFNSNVYFGASPYFRGPISYPAGTTKLQKYKLTYSITDSTYTTDNLFIRFQDTNTADNPFIIENVTLSIGSNFVDWTPAPEDQATQSQFTQLSDDMNLRVKKGDLVDQINLQAGNTLISSSGQLTLAADTIYFDTRKPVIIPNANITDTLNGKTFHDGDIINDANNTSNFYPFTIEPTGKASTTLFNSMDALRTEMSGGGLRTMYRAINSSGSQYEAYDGNFSGDIISLNSGFTNGKDMSFSQSVSGNQLTGQVVLSPLNGIHLWGSTQSIHFSGLQMNGTGISFNSYGNIIADQASTWWRVTNFSGSDIANFGTDTAGSNVIQFNRELDIGNFHINTGHTFTSADNDAIHFAKGKGGAVDIYADAVHYTSLVKSSLLSVKKDVKKADTAYWAQLVNSIDLATYQYKTDDNTSHLRLSSIVDDVNVTKQWQLPDVFISRDENGKLCGVDDSVLLNATLATVQEQQKEIDQLNGHNMELEARLNKLEAKLNG